MLSAHSFFHSSLRFFFITIARRKGEMMSTVSTPVMALAYQCRSHPGSIWRMMGSTKVNITAMVADDRMLYTSVLIPICISNCFQEFCSVLSGWLIDRWFSEAMTRDGNRFSRALYAGVASLII